MSEMIERVADALAAAVHISCHSDRCSCAGHERFECGTGISPIDLARVAIETMREPTEEMEFEGCTGVEACSPTCARHTWNFMIDEALRDTPSPPSPDSQ